MPPICIDHCVCTGRTFDDLLRQAKVEGWSLAQLRHCTGAGEGCGMCRPYLREAMRTGQTVFFRILSEPSDEGAA